MEEKMNYTGIVDQIKELDTEIKEWNYHYQTLRAQLEHADQSIMTLHKKKWRLEHFSYPKVRTMNRKVSIIFLWHMHQPPYQIPEAKSFLLPWTRFHGTKDYYDFPSLMASFPHMRAVFNLSPSLIDQIEGYASGEYGEKILELSRKPSDKLDFGENHHPRIFLRR